MLSIPTILSQLYPNKKEEEIKILADRCFDIGIEFYEDTWTSVGKNNLGEEQVKMNLVKTLFQSQFGYYGAVQEILTSMQKWSEDGTILFANLSVEDQDFYQYYYTLLGYLHFENISKASQILLLGSRFLLLAIVLDVPIYTNVQNYFRKYTYVAGLREDAIIFYSAIENNNTLIGSTRKTVSEWVVKFNNFFGLSFENRVDEFFVDNVEVSGLDDNTKLILNKIFTLYYSLKGGFIWREIEDDVPAGYERKDVVKGKSEDDYYLEKLGQANHEQIQEWLEDYKEVVDWIFLTDKSEDFMHRLFYILTQKIDTEDIEQMHLFIEFVSALQEKEWDVGGDLFYFDENTGGFHWNDEVLEILKSENDFLEKNKKEKSKSQGLDREQGAIAEGIKKLTSNDQK